MKKRIKKAVLIFCIAVLVLPAVSMTSAFAAEPPDGTVTTREPWYPSVSSSANDWQIVDGDYRDGKNGASTQVTNKSGSVVIRKNILPTADENIFEIALKVRTQVSWADVLDATSARIQNGKSDTSSKVHYFKIRSTSSTDKPVTVYFMNAPSSAPEDSLKPGGKYEVVYKKTYYLDPANTGEWFLFFNNPLIGTGDHGGQKQKVEPGCSYYIPVGDYMTKYDLLHHAAVGRTVTDTMGSGVSYVNGSIANVTSVPGVSGLTKASVSGDTLTWTIDSDGTIPVGEDYKLIKDTKNGKTTFYREYDLTYKVHLDASDPDFEPGKIYAANKEAKLDYTYDPRPSKDDSDYWNVFEESQSPLTFPVPSVKGTLYNLKFSKVDSETGKALAGAKFSLTGSYGASQISGVSAAKSKYNETSVSSAKADSKGDVVFEDVPWGTYTLKETEAPKGYDITFSDITRKLCYTTTPEILDVQGSEYWLNSSQIGSSGIVTNKPWPKAKVTLSKDIINYSDILSDKDRSSAFDMLISGFDLENVAFFNEDGDLLDSSTLSQALKHDEKITYTVGLKTGKGTFKLSEDLSGTGDLFSYESTVVSKNKDNSDSEGSASVKTDSGTASEVTINQGNDITLAVNNKYRLGDVKILKIDSATQKGLEGAQFEVYSSEKDDSEADAKTLIYKGETYYRIKTGTTGNAGTLAISGLPVSQSRSYVLKEYKAPGGYMLIEELIPFAYDKAGNIREIEKVGDDVSFSDNNWIIVKDHKLQGLPSTGGAGIYAFTLAGLLLIAVSVLQLLRRKKQAEL